MPARYRNPPVVEALCEIFFVGSVWDATIPGLFYDRIQRQFPKKTQVGQVGFELKLGPEEIGTRVVQGQPLSQFSRDDGSRMIQIARDLVVVNQLRPYPHFDDWKPSVIEMLSVYRELARPRWIERIGLRYINRVVIPHVRFEMETYFRVYPFIPTELATMHGPFLMRLELPPQHAEHRLILTFGNAPAEKPGTLALLLDLYDIATLGEGKEEDIEPALNDAHGNVEHAFENTITDAARELFEEIKE